jgi:antitoxin VapB
MKSTAKLFMHGRSQAVRLPKVFRMAGTEVAISKNGDKVELAPLQPRPSSWPDVFKAIDSLGPNDDYQDGWREQNLLPLEPKVTVD